MSALWVEETIPCRDPDCDGLAEPEGDEELRYWACQVCGYEFGFERVRSAEGTCQLGVSEDVRRRFASPANGRPAPVMIEIGRRPQ